MHGEEGVELGVDRRLDVAATVGEAGVVDEDVDAPNAAIVLATARAPPSNEATSVRSATARPPSASISSTTAAAGASSRPEPSSAAPMSLTTTDAPAPASAIA